MSQETKYLLITVTIITLTGIANIILATILYGIRE